MRKTGTFKKLFSRPLKIRHKLLIGFGLIVFMITVIGLLGVAGVKVINKEFSVINDHSYPQLFSLLEIRNLAGEIQTAINRIDLNKKAGGDSDAVMDVKKAASLIEQNSQRMDVLLEQYKIYMEEHEEDEVLYAKKMAEIKDYFVSLSMAYLEGGESSQDLIE
ncbi:MAG: MCP four helix bundle domain-containing protein, partial [Candidatus Omnitrophica bacterium]|nr:MCP four helix bundle domain-containing protein [Candidatus Omnitrophota bacterium]